MIWAQSAPLSYVDDCLNSDLLTMRAIMISACLDMRVSIAKHEPAKGNIANVFQKLSWPLLNLHTIP